MTGVLEPGQTVGRWRVQEVLGSGTSGTVYRARRGKSGPVAALKVFHATARWSVASRERWMREVRVLGSLDHRALARFIEAVHDDDTLALASELVVGESLEELVPRGLAVRRVLSIGSTIAEGLAYLHSRGLLHRDIKPSNVLVSRGDRTRLVDFGLARGFDEKTIVTSTSQIRLSLTYASPEVLLRKPAGSASDLYSLGVMLHEMLTGSPPFTAASPGQIATAHLTQKPPPPSSIRAGLSTWWDRITAKLLAKDPANRYSTARALADDFTTLSGSLVPRGP